MDQARCESPNGGRHSALRLVVLTPAQIVAPRPAERAPGAVRRRPPTTATALLYALLKLVGYGPSPSFSANLPGLTWAGPGECECCGAYISDQQRCGQCGSTFRLSRPRIPFSQYLPAQRPRFLSSTAARVVRGLRWNALDEIEKANSKASL
jgi:hypothetical protein